jgi:hypothetical protein
MRIEQGISLRELAFVRDVLIPRAWVQGPEVDELLRLRTRIEALFAGLHRDPAPTPSPDGEEGQPC